MQCHVCQNPYQLVDFYYVCTQCGHTYRTFDGNSVQFHAETYRKVFKRDSREFDNSGKVTSQFHLVRQKIVENRLKYIPISKKWSCLDIGAGAGTFAKKIAPFVHSVECTELDPALIQECRRLGFKTYSQDFFVLDLQKYDVVFAWHVLEHVDDVQGFVKKVANITNQYFILEVPCDRNVKKEFDGHFHLFNTVSLRKLLEQHQFTVEITEGIQKPSLLAIAKK